MLARPPLASCLTYKIWPVRRFPCSATHEHVLCARRWAGRCSPWKPHCSLSLPSIRVNTVDGVAVGASASEQSLAVRVLTRPAHTHTHVWRLYGRAQVQARCGGRRTQRRPSSWLTDPDSQGRVYTSRVSAYKITHRWGVFQITCYYSDCVT